MRRKEDDGERKRREEQVHTGLTGLTMTPHDRDTDKKVHECVSEDKEPRNFTVSATDSVYSEQVSLCPSNMLIMHF